LLAYSILANVSYSVSSIELTDCREIVLLCICVSVFVCMHERGPLAIQIGEF